MCSACTSCRLWLVQHATAAGFGLCSACTSCRVWLVQHATAAGFGLCSGCNSLDTVEHIKLMQAADLFLGLALDLFGNLGDGLAAVALAGSHKTGKVAPVPVAETLLQQLLPLLGLFFSEGLGVCGGGGNLCRYSVLTGTLQVQTDLSRTTLSLY